MFRIIIYCAIPILCVTAASHSLAASYETYRTEHATIHFEREEDLRDFFWRISGIDFRDMADRRGAGFVDRIVTRTQSILDMYPRDFSVDIYLKPSYQSGNIAFYSDTTRSITVYADRVTDGILAHEVAHAVMDAYFTLAPPRKVQEILSRYVDAHLWQDY